MVNDNGLVYIPLTDDYMFGKVFCNSKKPQYFANLYESIFNTKINTIEVFENTKMNRSSINNKMSVLDSLALINDEYVHIEMQKQINEGIERRIEFYPSKILARVVEVGTTYKEIKKIKSIWIFEEELNKEDGIYIDNIKKVFAKRGKDVENQIVEIIIVELGKIGDTLLKEELKDARKVWFYFMKAKEVKQLESIRKEYPVINEIVENECMETKSIAEIWSQVRQEEMERLYNTYISDAEEKGMEKGMEKGKRKGFQEKEINVILTMYKLNFTFDIISQVVNLSKEKVEEIIKKENAI